MADLRSFWKAGQSAIHPASVSMADLLAQMRKEGKSPKTHDAKCNKCGMGWWMGGLTHAFECDGDVIFVKKPAN